MNCLLCGSRIPFRRSHAGERCCCDQHETLLRKRESTEVVNRLGGPVEPRPPAAPPPVSEPSREAHLAPVPEQRFDAPAAPSASKPQPKAPAKPSEKGRCQYCKAKLGLRAWITGSRFCSAAHKSAFSQQETEAIFQRLQDIGDSEPPPILQPPAAPAPETRPQAAQVDPEALARLEDLPAMAGYLIDAQAPTAFAADAKTTKINADACEAPVAPARPAHSPLIESR